MKLRKKRYYVILFFLLILISYLFWGPLFPWNPFKPGYETIKSSKATIYIRDVTAKDSVVYDINQIIQQEEEFHDLKFAHDFKIIVLSENSNMRRYLPWLKGTGYSVSLSLMNLIYIGPLARKSPNGIGPHLKHELSHLLIGQNTTFKKSMVMHKQGWLVEGVAEYFSHHSFYSKTEFFELFGNTDFHALGLPEQNPLKMSAWDLKFYYMYYKLFIEFLVENYGIRKFQVYMKEYIQSPENFEKLFEEVYTDDIGSILDKFHVDLAMQNELIQR